MLEVCKKCIEIFELLKTNENPLENILLFAIAFPSRGCCENQFSHSGGRCANFILCSAPSVGITLSTNSGSPKRERG